VAGWEGRNMDTDQRIAELEDAVIVLSNLLQMKCGYYAADVNGAVVATGQQFQEWAEAVQSNRPGAAE
jgi:hypothetical protein